MASMNKAKDVEDYISRFPEEVQESLQRLRVAIKKAVPKAEEVISYGMPAYKLNGVLVYFAAYKNHIGFYPTAIGIKAFTDELSNYKSSKGAVQFPITEPIPIGLITKIVKFRAKENLKHAKENK
jgi:uncharacterized protein YdhG (YjbR/CyaY superfamily)